jgi:hypothetical protein
MYDFVSHVPFIPDLLHYPPVKDIDRNDRIDFNEVFHIHELVLFPNTDPFAIVRRLVDIYKGVHKSHAKCI